METSSQLLLTFLLNACWQIALIAAVAAFCDWLLRQTSARYRHWLWVTALVLSIFLPALTSSRLLEGTSSSGHRRQQAMAQQAAVVPIPLPPKTALNETTVLPVSLPSSPKELGALIPINRGLAAALVAFYLLFLCYRGLKLLVAWRKTRVMSRSAYAVDFLEQAQATIRRCQKAVGVTRVRILCSASIPVPVTVGTLTPLVILPEHLLQEADTDVLTSAIGHELVHVRRRDYLLNLIYELLYLPLSFHPAAVLVRRRINQTRELGCDELVTEKLLDAEVYARSLVQLAGAAIPLRRSTTTITVGIADADILEERVMTMLKRSKTGVGRKRWLLIAATLCLAVPCLAAAPFALRVNINPRISAAMAPETAAVPVEALETSQQDTAREAKRAEREAQQKEALERNVAREAMQKLQAEAEAQRRIEQMHTAAESLHQEQSQEAREKREREEQMLKEHRMREERMREEMEAQNPELQAKRQAEREARARRQAELASVVKVSMDRAIQIATNQMPGTVMECRLVGERGQVFYNILIVPTEASETRTINTPEGTKSVPVNIIQIVQVNAVDGQIMAIKKERLFEPVPDK